MRVKDPLEDLDIDAKKVAIYIAATIVLAIGYGILFPTQVALVAMLLSFPALIFFHELGHFTIAKRTGMKVTEFFVGFGPRLWSFRKGETEYGIKAIPLGGYCRVIGMIPEEDVAPEDESRTYRSKPWSSKVGMAFAGPAANLLIAVVLMFSVLYFAGDYRASTVSTKLAKTTAFAAEAQLRPGDTVIAINGHAIDRWADVRAQIAGTPANPTKVGTPVRVTVRRGNEVIEKSVTVGEIVQRDGSKTVGIGITPSYYLPHPGVFSAVADAPRQVADVGWASMKALGGIFSPAGISNYFRILTGDHSKNTNEQNRFLSPVGFAQVANDAVKSGWVDAVGLLIAINVFVALLNLLPLLPFDGGHIAVATYEFIASRVRRRRVRVNTARLMPLTVAVFGILMFISISSLFLDATRGVANPF